MIKKRIGRISFVNYLLFIVFVFFFALGGLAEDRAWVENLGAEHPIFALIINAPQFMAALFVFLLFIIMLRLHDLNIKGVWAILGVLGIPYLMIAAGGGDNRYSVKLKKEGSIIGTICMVVQLYYMITLFIGQLDYHKRTYVAEGLGFLASKKEQVAQYYKEKGVLPSATDISQSEKLVGRAVDDITLGNNGKITIHFNSKVKAGGYLTLAPTIEKEEVRWQCERTNLA